jgi:proline iminopeptidase
MSSGTGTDLPAASEGYVRAGDARLFTRSVGSGPPLIVLHGGPDFDHAYLLPELDQLAAHARLVYYDQRGRGRSAIGVEPNDVSIASEIADLEALRRSLGVGAIGVLGHSWGGLLAMEYATRHPDRVTHLVVLSTAPASHGDWMGFREGLPAMRGPGDVERMREIAAGEAFRSGDIAAEAEYYRLHFSPTVRDARLRARIVGRLRLHFDPTGVLLARAIEDRLYSETSDDAGYDLLPHLAGLDTPTLVLHAEHDFIPLDVPTHIAETMPRARLTILPGVGHFSFIERPDLVEHEIARFLAD